MCGSHRWPKLLVLFGIGIVHRYFGLWYQVSVSVALDLKHWYYYCYRYRRGSNSDTSIGIVEKIWYHPSLITIHTHLDLISIIIKWIMLTGVPYTSNVIFLPSKQRWAILSVLVSLNDTLASDTKYRYRWISSIDTNIGIAGSQTSILVSVLVSLV